MSVECGVIAGFFFLMAIIFIRSKHKEWAWATLPMILVPLVDFVLETVVVSMLKFNVNVFGGVVAMIIAVAVAAAWIGVVSQNLKSKKTSITYIGISNAFNVALTAIIVGSMLEKSGVLSPLI